MSVWFGKDRQLKKNKKGVHICLSHSGTGSFSNSKHPKGFICFFSLPYLSGALITGKKDETDCSIFLNMTYCRIRVVRYTTNPSFYTL